MSIKSAFLVLALGLASVGAAQAQSVSISVNSGPRLAPPPVHVVAHPPVHVVHQAPVVVHRNHPHPPAPHARVPSRPDAWGHVSHAPSHARHDNRYRPQVNPQHRAPVRVGESLSRQELNRARDVDWRRAGLNAPARGQQWVSLDGHHLLINMSTDRVLRVL